jgi:hypothetical protein
MSTISAGTTTTTALVQTGDTTGELVIKTNNGNTTAATFTTGGLFQFNSGYGSVATAYGCRAWVNFNGTGTPSIRASGNVSSITDDGTALYTINFTTALPDADYSAQSIGGGTDVLGTRVAVVGQNATASTRTTTAYSIYIRDDGGTKECSIVNVAIFR